MLNKMNFRLAAIFVFSWNTAPLTACQQQAFEPPAIHFAQARQLDESEANSGATQFEPLDDARTDLNERPPVSIFHNGLRNDQPADESTGAVDSTTVFSSQAIPFRSSESQEFDAQPLPPQPSRPFPGNPAIQPGQDDSPLEQLDPNRLKLESATDPAGIETAAQPQRQILQPYNSLSTQTPGTAQSSPQIEVQPIRPSFDGNGFDRVDSQPQSVLTPRISTDGVDSSRTISAGFSQSPQQVAPLDQNLIDSLIATYDVSSSTTPLPGQPAGLRDLLVSTPIQYRQALVQQYWETFFDWATLQNRVAHSSWLNQMPNPRSTPEQLMLQTAQQIAANEMLSAEIQLARSQSKLQQMAGLRGELPPLPLNLPLVSRYNSHYDWYASRQMIPAKLGGIDQMLPKTHQLIFQRAATVRHATNSRDQTSRAFSAGQVALADVLESGRLWQSSLQGFVSTVVGYNQAISDYALTITPPQQPLDQIVTMLLAKPKPIAEVARRDNFSQNPPIDYNQPNPPPIPPRSPGNSVLDRNSGPTPEFKTPSAQHSNQINQFNATDTNSFSAGGQPIDSNAAQLNAAKFNSNPNPSNRPANIQPSGGNFGG